MRPIAAFSAAWISTLPNVPTTIDLGYTEFEFNGWIAVMLATGTGRYERGARDAGIWKQ